VREESIDAGGGRHNGLGMGSDFPLRSVGRRPRNAFLCGPLRSLRLCVELLRELAPRRQSRDHRPLLVRRELRPAGDFVDRSQAPLAIARARIHPAHVDTRRLHLVLRRRRIGKWIANVAHAPCPSHCCRNPRRPSAFSAPSALKLFTIQATRFAAIAFPARETGLRPRCAEMNCPASTIRSRSSPVSMPRPWSRYTTSSVATFPVAPLA